MDRLESDLRDEFARRVATHPPIGHLADAAVRRGKRAQRRRTALTGGAAAMVAVVAVVAASVFPDWSGQPSKAPAATVSGPPRVPMFVAQDGELIDWVDGVPRTRPVRALEPVAQVPSGLLVVIGQPPALGLLGPNADEPRILLRGLAGSAVAVSDDGQRATVVVVGSGRRPELQEIDLASGQVLRSVHAIGLGEQIRPVAYSADAVLLTVGEGRAQRSLLWERGDDQVVAPLDRFGAALGGADAPFSDEAGAVGGRGAFAVPDDRCRVEVHQLRNGDGSPWKLCDEAFAGFSPDGDAVLAVNATRVALVVHDANNGEAEHTFNAPEGLRAYGWETKDTILYTTIADGRTVIVRCSISTGDCDNAAEFSYTDRIPQPVRRFD